MSNLPSPQTDPSKSNPYAASIRLQSKTMSQAYGQRRHDLRNGKQPKYVDPDRKELNRTLVQQRPIPNIRDEIIELRKRRGAQRALKSNAAIVKSGIVTFGTEAAKMFNALPEDEQDAALEQLIQLLADRLETRVESLVVHLDETEIHAHFDLRAFANDGQPICRSMNRTALSEFQDMTADVLKRYCPDIQRGNSKRSRLNAGAQYPDTLNRSVRQLHEDLPKEITQKEQEVRNLDADIAARLASVQKDKVRVTELGNREDLNAKERKRLGDYRARIEKKEEALKETAEQLQTAKVELATWQELLTAKEAENAQTAEKLERKAAMAKEQQEHVLKDAQHTKESYEAGIVAVESIIDEMAAGTLEETSEEIILKNPGPVLAAPKPVRDRLTKLVHRYLDLQEAWENRTARLNRMFERVTKWLGREDLAVEAQIQGEAITRDWELSLNLPDPKPPWAK